MCAREYRLARLPVTKAWLNSGTPVCRFRSLSRVKVTVRMGDSPLSKKTYAEKWVELLLKT